MTVRSYLLEFNAAASSLFAFLLKPITTAHPVKNDLRAGLIAQEYFLKS